MGSIDPDSLWEGQAWWVAWADYWEEGTFCHHHVREIEDELDRSNKRTINRTLNKMVELGWLERLEPENLGQYNDFVNDNPFLYKLSEEAENRLSKYSQMQTKLDGQW